MASTESLLFLVVAATPAGCPALGLVVAGSMGWEHIVCFVRGAGGPSGLWWYRKAFAIWLVTWEPCTLSSCAKHQEIYALDKKVSLWPVLLFVHIQVISTHQPDINHV